jgi:hypothetical protein
MGWKGTIRSINAAANRADRNAKKRQRDLQNRHKQHEKMQELEQAAYEVEVFENHIEVIQSVHKECSDRVDWNKVAVMPAPEKPGFSNKLELAAISKKDNYVPGFIDRIFKRIERKLKDFDAAIEIARSEDRKNHEIAINQWEQDHNDWADNVEQSNLLLSGDPEAKIKTIKELNPFSELNTLGSSLHFVVTENSLLIVTIKIHGEEIIPSEQKSLLKSGKLSVKKMPIGKFNEIYQDYVCSSVLRAGQDHEHLARTLA